MNQVYVFLIRNDVWIYMLSAIGLAWYLSQLVSARRSLRSAMFGLEKERGQQKQRRALVISFILVAVIAVVGYVNLSVAPTLPPELLRPPTPTPDIFATPLSSPTPIGTNEATEPSLAPTVTIAGESQDLPPASRDQEEDAIVEPTPPVVIGDCTADVNINSPPSGTRVSGIVTLFGTAGGEQSLEYDLDYWGDGTGNRWLSLLDERLPTPLVDEILGTLELSSFPGGIYFIRLRVFNAEGDPIEQCAIQLEFDPAGP